MRLSLLSTSVAVCLCCACSNALDRAIESAGSNRPELEKVIEHYRNDNPHKLRAAEFLIENMPHIIPTQAIKSTSITIMQLVFWKTIP